MKKTIIISCLCVSVLLLSILFGTIVGKNLSKDIKVMSEKEMCEYEINNRLLGHIEAKCFKYIQPTIGGLPNEPSN